MYYDVIEIRDAIKAAATMKNAGGKARSDVASFFERMGMESRVVLLQESERASESGLRKLFWHKRVIDTLEAALSDVKAGDTVFFQFPLLGHSMFCSALLKRLRKRGIQSVLLVHDLETLRGKKMSASFASKMRVYAEEKQALYASTRIIVHNETMKRYLEKSGIPARKMISLEIFDYLLPEGEPFDQTHFKKNTGVIVAGNLERKKSGYLYSLPEQVHWNLYGVGYVDEGKSNIAYKGSFLPEELIVHLEGGFGLVWDGPSSETCTGIYGDYLRINNPHKTSLYLAAGLPVIIWKEAALASFVEENGVGVTVSSLYEIKDTIDSISDAEYEQMKLNARRVGMRLREGYYLRSAIEKI